MNTAYSVDSATLIVDQTHPVLSSGKPHCKKNHELKEKQLLNSNLVLMMHICVQRIVKVSELVKVE